MSPDGPKNAKQNLDLGESRDPAVDDMLVQYGITASYLEGGVGLSGICPEGGRELILAVMADISQNPSKFVDDARLALELAVKKVAAQNASWLVESTFN